MNRTGNVGLLLIGVASCIWAFAYYIKIQKMNMPKADYQILQIGKMARDQFLIDKNSGRIWNKLCSDVSSDGFDCNGEILWEEMYITNLTPKNSPVSTLHDLFMQEQANKNALKNASGKPTFNPLDSIVPRPK